MIDWVDGGLVNEVATAEKFVDKWHFDRGHAQYLSLSRETCHIVKKSTFH